jgi:hypothetical protein
MTKIKFVASRPTARLDRAERYRAWLPGDLPGQPSLLVFCMGEHHWLVRDVHSEPLRQLTCTDESEFGEIADRLLAMRHTPAGNP